MRTLLVVLFAVILVSLASCGNRGPDTVSVEKVYYTNHYKLLNDSIATAKYRGETLIYKKVKSGKSQAFRLIKN